MAMTTTSTLDDALPKMIAAARLTLKQTGVTRKRVDTVTLGEGQGLTYNEPQISSFSVIALTQGTDLSQAQTVSDTNVAISVSQAGGQVVIHDLAVKALKDPIMRRIGEGLANAYTNYIDNDLTSLFSGFDAGFGSAGSSFTSGWLQAGQARLQNASRPVSGEITIILQPYHYRDIASDISGLTSGLWMYRSGTPAVEVTPGSSITGLTEEVWKNYWVGRLGGADVLIDPTISIDGSDDAYSAIFARDALIFVEYDEPETETDRDASNRATEINYVGTQGRGERVGTWGFYFLADATAPTA
jgi:hypothetical protein